MDVAWQNAPDSKTPVWAFRRAGFEPRQASERDLTRIDVVDAVHGEERFELMPRLRIRFQGLHTGWPLMLRGGEERFR
jgi:hypothetical protein